MTSSRTLLTLSPLARAAGSLAHEIVHELAHAWQHQYALEEGLARTVEWGTEGGADLVADETLRRHLGIPLDAEWDWVVQRARDPFRAALAARAQAVNGGLVVGRATGASFLLWLVQRQVLVGGIPYPEAISSVLRGSLVGFFQPGGLVSRMTAALPGTWSPLDAHLEWLVAQALDDRAPARGALRNPTFLDAFEGFEPEARLRSGTGARHEGEAFAGSARYVELETGAAGGVLEISSDTEALVWVVARYR